MAPKYPSPVLPSRLDDRQSAFVARRFALPLSTAMQRVRRALEEWSIDRDAIHSVVRDHATVTMDVTRWTSLEVRIDAAAAPEGDATGIGTSITVRATTAGLTMGVLLLNSVVGIPVAFWLRKRERARAFEEGRALVERIHEALCAGEAGPPVRA